METILASTDQVVEQVQKANEPQPYVCPNCNYILGEKYYDKITRLRLYRNARPQSAGLMDVNILQHVRFSGYEFPSGKIYCEHCGYIDEWHASGAALRELLKRKEKRDKRAAQREAECVEESIDS
jgi:hypothetical protein